MKKQKLLFICQHYYPEKFSITAVCEDFAKHGCDVTVLTGLPNYHINSQNRVPRAYRFGKRRTENINGVKVIRCLEIGRRNNVFMLTLNYLSFYISSRIKIRHIKDDFDKVICYQYSPITMAAAGVSYAKKHHKELILYCFDLWPESLKTYNIRERNFVFKIADHISRNIYQKADKIIISSQPFEEYFTKHHHIAKKKIYYLPQYSEDYGKKIKNSKDPNFIHLLYAGNIGKMQNLECLIYAIARVHTTKRFIVDIVGSGSNFLEVHNLVRRLHLDDKIIFHGEKNAEEILKYYSMADAMLLTLKDDGSYVSKTLPLKLQSYMSTGKPILASINGAAADIMKEYKCGYCVPANAYKDFATIIEKYINENPKISYKTNEKFYFDNNIQELAKILWSKK